MGSPIDENIGEHGFNIDKLVLVSIFGQFAN